MAEDNGCMEAYLRLSKVIRAWIMVRAEVADPSTMAQAIYGLNSKLTWPNRHIIRADVVDGGLGLQLDFDIMVPVWAEVPDGIRAIRDLIEELGPRVVGIALVPGTEEIHHPHPPHEAWGIIPGAEGSPGARPMGFNPWG